MGHSYLPQCWPECTVRGVHLHTDRSSQSQIALKQSLPCWIRKTDSRGHHLNTSDKPCSHCIWMHPNLIFPPNVIHAHLFLNDSVNWSVNSNRGNFLYVKILINCRKHIAYCALVICTSNMHWCTVCLKWHLLWTETIVRVTTDVKMLRLMHKCKTEVHRNLFM